MQQEDLKLFCEILGVLGCVYRQEIGSITTEVYWRALEKYPIEAVQSAVDRHISSDNGEWWPTPAHLIKIIDGGSEAKALAAWSKVLNALKTIGSDRSVVFDDAIIHAVVNDMGGWQSLNAGSINQMTFIAKDFAKRYCAYLTSGLQEYPLMLRGRWAGTKYEELPVYIGDKEKARQIYNIDNVINLPVPEKTPVDIEAAKKKIRELAESLKLTAG